MMFLTRLLLPSQMGEVALLGIIYGFTQFLGTLGLNHASPLIIQQQASLNRMDLVRSYIKRGIILVLLSSFLLMVCLQLLAPIVLGEGYLSPLIFQVTIIIIPFSAMDAFLDSVLLARYRIHRLAIGRTVFDCVRIGSTVGLVWLGFNVLGVAYGWLFAEVSAVLIFTSASLTSLESSSSVIDMRPVLAFALPSLIFQTIDVTIQNTDRLILLTYSDLSALGVYDVILGLLFMMSFVSLAVATSLYPILTKIHFDKSRREDKRESLSYSVSVLARYILLLLIPVSILASMNSPSILRILFGSTYALFPNAALSLSILVISYSLWGLTYALHVVIRTLSEARFFILTGIGVFFVELILCIYLTSSLGLLGAALVRCVYICLLFLSAYMWLRRNGIIWLSNEVRSIIRILCASIPSSLLLLVLSPLDLPSLVVYAMLSLLVYMGLLFLFREVTALDFKIARRLLPLRLHGIITRIEQAYLSEAVGS